MLLNQWQGDSDKQPITQRGKKNSSLSDSTKISISAPAVLAHFLFIVPHAEELKRETKFTDIEEDR